MNKFLAALGLGILMMAPLSAQDTMRFNIPFAFVAGDHSMPAGEYRVTVDQNFNQARFEALANTSLHVVRLVPGRTERPYSNAQTASAKFTKYGDQYFLTGIWKSGATSGNDTIPSRRQVESAKTAGAVTESISIGSN